VLATRKYLMTNGIIKSPSPFEREVNQKRIQFAALETELAEAELTFATYQNSLRYFEEYYHARVGSYLIGLDELNARLTEVLSVLSPQDERLHQEAKTAREQAEKTYREASGFSDPEMTASQPKKFEPSVDLKKLYREIAKKVHPDLGKNDEDREHRTRLMQEVNKAYSEQNIEELKNILADWNDFDEDYFSDQVESEIKRLDSLILKVKQKIREINQQRIILERSELGQLNSQFVIAKEHGVDVLENVILDIQARINIKSKLILKIVNMILEND